jgi:hypothetical protein
MAIAMPVMPETLVVGGFVLQMILRRRRIA